MTARSVATLDSRWTFAPGRQEGLKDFTRVLERGSSEFLRGGGYADVKRVRTPAMEEFAVKVVVLRGKESEERTQKMVKSEIEIWSCCKHPNILPFLGLSFEKTLPFPSLVSPFMHNGSCRPLLEPQSVQLVDIIKGCCSALRYLHTMEIFHGGIHAGNILLSDTWQPLLSDFGCASHVSASSAEDECFEEGGCNRWTAPEVILGECGESAASDMYSVGLLIIEIAVQKPVYHSLTHPAFLTALFMDKLPDILENSEIVVGELSSTLLELSRQCRMKDMPSRPTAERALLSLS